MKITITILRIWMYSFLVVKDDSRVCSIAVTYVIKKIHFYIEYKYYKILNSTDYDRYPTIMDSSCSKNVAISTLAVRSDFRTSNFGVTKTLIAHKLSQHIYNSLPSCYISNRSLLWLFSTICNNFNHSLSKMKFQHTFHI